MAGKDGEASSVNLNSVPAGPLDGLGGWLALVGLGVLLSPFLLLFQAYQNFAWLREPGAWRYLTDPASEGYVPGFGILAIAELIAVVAFLAVAVWLIFLFFGKDRRFPTVYIAFLLGSLFVLIADVLAARVVFPDVPVLDEQTTRALVRGTVACVIWIPYMLVSKRVAATFRR